MSQLHTTQDQPRNASTSETPRTNVTMLRAPLINRLIDPSNVVFSLVFCQQTRREFEVQQAS